VRPRRLTGGFHLLAAVSFPTRSLSHSLPSGTELSAPVALARALFPISTSRAHFVNTPSRSLRVPSPSRYVVGPPYQLCLPRAPPWTNTRALAHAHRDPRPRRPPMHPSSFFSTARTRTSSPFHFAQDRALPTLLDLAGDPRPPCWSPSSPEATPSHPELRPEVRRLFLCLVYLIHASSWPIQSRGVRTRLLAAPRPVSGQPSPVPCPGVDP
jgi:hypothetical protein